MAFVPFSLRIEDHVKTRNILSSIIVLTIFSTEHDLQSGVWLIIEHFALSANQSAPKKRASDGAREVIQLPPLSQPHSHRINVA